MKTVLRLVLALGLLVGSLLLASCGRSAATARLSLSPTAANATTTVAPVKPSITAPPTSSPTFAPSPTPARAEPQRTLRVLSTQPATTLNPITALSGAVYLANIYETLVRANPPGAKKPLAPLLSERWERSADGKVWTFYLRRGVTFHDGEPLSAEAARLALLADRRYGRSTFLWRVVDKIEAVDDLTLRFRLHTPADLPRLLAAPYGAYIVSPKALQAWQKDAFYFDEGHDGGTGPYTVAEYKAGESLTLKAYKPYRRGWTADQAKEVIITLTDRPEEWRQLISQGKVDAAMPFFAAERAFSPPKGYSTVAADSFIQMLVFFNTKHKPLDDARIRRALALATPSGQGGSLGEWVHPVRSPLPPGLWPYSDAVQALPYDPQQAKTMLTDLNAEGLRLTMTYNSESAMQAAVAKAIQKAYAAAGIELTLRPMPWREQWENARAFPDDPKTQDLFLMEYAPLYPDGRDVLHTLFGSSGRYFLNLSYWESDAFDRLLAEADARAATSPSEAEAFYAEAMNLLAKEAPAVFLFTERQPFVLSERVHGFAYNPYYPDVPFWFAQLTLSKGR